MSSSRRLIPYYRRSGSFKSALYLVVLMFIGACSTPAPQLSPDEENTSYVYVGKPPTPPPGIVRYCWEEPIVIFQSHGPGLEDGGDWYHPSYVAVREVRSGKWRPCEAYPDETRGETLNER